MSNRIGSCSCGGAWEVNRDRGYLYGEYRTDRPWHHFSFTNDPEGDGDFIEINVNFCPFCGEQLVDEIDEENISDEGLENIKAREESVDVYTMIDDIKEQIKEEITDMMNSWNQINSSAYSNEKLLGFIKNAYKECIEVIENAGE